MHDASKAGQEYMFPTGIADGSFKNSDHYYSLGFPFPLLSLPHLQIICHTDSMRDQTDFR